MGPQNYRLVNILFKMKFFVYFKMKNFGEKKKKKACHAANLQQRA